MTGRRSARITAGLFLTNQVRWNESGLTELHIFSQLYQHVLSLKAAGRHCAGCMIGSYLGFSKSTVQVWKVAEMVKNNIGKIFIEWQEILQTNINAFQSWCTVYYFVIPNMNNLKSWYTVLTSCKARWLSLSLRSKRQIF